MTADSSFDTLQAIKVSHDLAEPVEWNIIFLNDDVTPMDFVMAVLCDSFDYDPDLAHEKMLEVHVEGQAVIATYPFEIAEQKGSEVVNAATKAGYPLTVRVEPDA